MAQKKRVWGAQNAHTHKNIYILKKLNNVSIQLLKHFYVGTTFFLQCLTMQKETKEIHGHGGICKH